MADKKGGRVKGDVWDMAVCVGSPLEYTRARDAFQSVITLLNGQPLSMADSGLIQFMKMARDSVCITRNE